MIKQLKPAVALLAGLLFFAGCGRTATDAEENSDEIIEPNLLYGIPADNYRLEQQIIDRGETLGQILNRYGVSAAQIDQLDKASKDVFPLRNIRAGRSYTAFIHEDSLNAPHLDYLVYEQSISQYVVFGLADDSISVTKGEKEYDDRFLALGGDRRRRHASLSRRRNGGHLSIDDQFLQHPERR